MKLKFQTSTGHYDFCHPQEKQFAISINVFDNSKLITHCSFCFKEDKGIEFNPEKYLDFDSLIQDMKYVIDLFKKGVLYSSSIPDIDKVLTLIHQNYETFKLNWIIERRKERQDKIRKLKGEIKLLNAQEA